VVSNYGELGNCAGCFPGISVNKIVQGARVGTLRFPLSSCTRCPRNNYRKLEGECYGPNNENSLYEQGFGNASVTNSSHSRCSGNSRIITVVAEVTNNKYTYCMVQPV
jgi:hypothetical protein